MGKVQIEDVHKDHGRTVCLLCDNHGEQNKHTFVLRYVSGKKPKP